MFKKIYGLFLLLAIILPVPLLILTYKADAQVADESFEFIEEESTSDIPDYVLYAESIKGDIETAFSQDIITEQSFVALNDRLTAIEERLISVQNMLYNLTATWQQN